MRVKVVICYEIIKIIFNAYNKRDRRKNSFFFFKSCCVYSRRVVLVEYKKFPFLSSGKLELYNDDNNFLYTHT